MDMFYREQSQIFDIGISLFNLNLELLKQTLKIIIITFPLNL